MKSSKKIILATMLSGVATCTMAQNNGLLFTGRLDGTQSVPANSSTAMAVASVKMNKTMDTAFVDVSTAHLSGPITGIHIHKGVAGSNGGVVVGLQGVTGMNVRTYFTKFPDGFFRQLFTDSLYLNVHTAQFPSGEIRSQLKLETDWSFKANLDGHQSVPMNMTTNGNGLGVFNLSRDMKKLKCYVVSDQLSGPVTAIHLHNAAKGTNGSVVAPLTNTGNVSVAEVDPTSFITELLAGKIYVNIHTSLNPGGEIRGQLWTSKGLQFDAMLDGTQANLPNVTAKGVGSFYLSAGMDSLWYDVSTAGLSGAITGCHFHAGKKGSSGGVVIGLSTIVGNNVKGIITGSSLTTQVVNQLLSGEIYINVHTAANAGGEIRGQVMGLAREAFTFKLDAMQNVNPNSAIKAEGTGIATIDRDMTNIHYMVCVNGLSGAITGSHFHKGMMGQSGGVEIGVSNFTKVDMDDIAFGYLPITVDQVNLFITKNIYFNVHTAANPGGEIRGQVMDKSMVPMLTSISSATLATNTALFPNPATSSTQVTFEATERTEATISLVDIHGNTVLRQSSSVNAGHNSIYISLNSVKPGVYQVEVSSKESTILRKKLTVN